MTLTAPAPRTFPTVEQGTYTGIVDTITVEDYTGIADKFGYRGYKLIFRWRLEGVKTDDGEPFTLPQYVKFETGSAPYAKGARAGRLPWLTEITRAFGEADIEPDDSVDEQLWVGKRAKLSILQQVQPDATFKNAINAVSKLAKPATVGQATARPVARPAAPAAVEDLDSDQVPF